MKEFGKYDHPRSGRIQRTLLLVQYIKAELVRFTIRETWNSFTNRVRAYIAHLMATVMLLLKCEDSERAGISVWPINEPET